MNATPQSIADAAKTCTCKTCPGTSCTCGCQKPAAPAACNCGTPCQCGQDCACSKS